MSWNDKEPDDKDNPWRRSGSAESLEEQVANLLNKAYRSMGGGGSGGSSPLGSGFFSFRIFSYLLLLLVSLWVLGGFYALDAREQAVVLRFGKFHAVRQEGLNWHMLLVDRVFRENTTEVRNYRHEAEMLTEDQNIVSVPITVQYVVGDIKDFILNLDNPELSLRLSTESAVRHVVGENKMDNVLSVGRAVIATDIQERLQRYQGNYRSGLRIVKVNLLKGNPPQQVQADFVDVVRAAEDKERMRNEAEAYSNRILPETRGQASRLLQEAQGYRQRVEAHAKGEASRFSQQLAAYQKAPEITRQRLYLDAMEEVLQSSSKILLDTGSSGSSALFYLPLDQLVNRSRSEAPESQSEVDVRRLIEDSLLNHLGANEEKSTRTRTRRK